MTEEEWRGKGHSTMSDGPASFIEEYLAQNPPPETPPVDGLTRTALEYGIVRQPGESDDTLRARVMRTMRAAMAGQVVVHNFPGTVLVPNFPLVQPPSVLPHGQMVWLDAKARIREAYPLSVLNDGDDEFAPDLAPAPQPPPSTPETHIEIRPEEAQRGPPEILSWIMLGVLAAFAMMIAILTGMPR